MLLLWRQGVVHHVTCMHLPNTVGPVSKVREAERGCTSLAIQRPFKVLL